MAKFDTTKNKLKKLWDAQVRNLNRIIRLEEDEKNAKKRPPKVNQLQQNLKILHNLNQDWSFMDFLELPEGLWFFKNWNIELGEIDIRTLTFFKIEILHRLGNSEAGDNINLPDPAFFKKQMFFDIKDKIDAPTSNIKNVIFRASIFIEKPNIFDSIPPYQVKILGEIHNLNDFD